MSRRSEKLKRRMRVYGYARTATGVRPKRGRPKVIVPPQLAYKKLTKEEERYLELVDRWLCESGKTLRCVAKSRRIDLKKIKGRRALAEAIAADIMLREMEEKE